MRRRFGEAAEPILAAHQDYLCRIASTGNGKHNLFYRMVTCGRYKVWRVTRSDAWRAGVQIFDPVTRQPVTPEQAREAALDKAAYDQNYECAFADENLTLLTHELISAAEREDVGVICDQSWSASARALFRGAKGALYAGVDVGRNRDLTVMTVVEDLDGLKCRCGESSGLPGCDCRINKSGWERFAGWRSFGWRAST